MFYNILSIWETSLEFSNIMSCVYKFPLLSLQTNVKHIFHTFMATTQQRSSQDMVQLLAI